MKAQPGLVLDDTQWCDLDCTLELRNALYLQRLLFVDRAEVFFVLFRDGFEPLPLVTAV